MGTAGSVYRLHGVVGINCLVAHRTLRHGRDQKLRCAISCPHRTCSKGWGLPFPVVCGVYARTIRATSHACLTVSLGSFCTSIRYIRHKLSPVAAHLIITSRDQARKAVYLTISPTLGTCKVPNEPQLFRIAEGVGRLGHREPSLPLSCVITGPQVTFCVACDAQVCDVCLHRITPRSVRTCDVSRIFVSIASCLTDAGVATHRVTREVVHRILRRANVATATNVKDGLCLTGITVSVITGRVPTSGSNIQVTDLSRRDCHQGL